MDRSQYECIHCGCSMDHSVDSCPICREQFYWMVITEGLPDPDQLEAFLLMMEAMHPEEASREFMTFDEQLWLPAYFWNKNPDARLLEHFS